MIATVLKDISPEIKTGDVLVKDGNFYVKMGSVKGTVEHEIHGHKVNPPNFYHESQVEAMTEYFQLSND